MDAQVIQNQELFESAIAGLTSTPKTLDSKWFYDRAGSLLFEDITELPEYYPTRTELSVLTKNADLLEKYIPDNSVLVELGSGASKKTRVLLDKFANLRAYVPTDISGPFLEQVAQRLQRDYSHLNIQPITADFNAPIPMPSSLEPSQKIAFFPGSTLGNLERPEAIQLLQNLRSWKGISGFILGVDLVKDTSVLIDAYDDSQNVTAAFNLNLLHRLNREVGATFDTGSFLHQARWNQEQSRIEMHLLSTQNQSVLIGGQEIEFAKGESIHTENSHKYTRASLTELAMLSGWRVAEFLTDENQYFAVSVLIPAG